jgi:hypothetical protein
LTVKIEDQLFRLWIRPGLSAEEYAEASHAIFRHLVDPPQSPKRRREVAIRQALAIYEGPVSRRAKELERRFRLYLSGAWLRERNLVELPDPRSVEKVCLHRLARLNEGASL